MTGFDRRLDYSTARFCIKRCCRHIPKILLHNTRKSDTTALPPFTPTPTAVNVIGGYCRALCQQFLHSPRSRVHAIAPRGCAQYTISHFCVCMLHAACPRVERKAPSRSFPRLQFLLLWEKLRETGLIRVNQEPHQIIIRWGAQNF